MKINITARKFKAHESLKDMIKSEVSSLEKFNDEILSADVILSYRNVKESIKIAEIVIHIPGQTISATEEAEEYSKAISGVIRKLERQLEKVKTKKELLTR
jgi:putative sigma-54 modulation protein